MTSQLRTTMQAIMMLLPHQQQQAAGSDGVSLTLVVDNAKGKSFNTSSSAFMDVPPLRSLTIWDSIHLHHHHQHNEDHRDGDMEHLQPPLPLMLPPPPPPPPLKRYMSQPYTLPIGSGSRWDAMPTSSSSFTHMPKKNSNSSSPYFSLTETLSVRMPVRGSDNDLLKSRTATTVGASVLPLPPMKSDTPPSFVRRSNSFDATTSGGYQVLPPILPVRRKMETADVIIHALEEIGIMDD